MRILDKNTDFYDYLQNVYYDPSVTFDRTDSFELTKEIFCNHLYAYDYMRVSNEKYKFALLQVCNTFWLFLIEVTSKNDFGKPEAYTAELVLTWKNYSRKRQLIRLDVIEFGFEVYKIISDTYKMRTRFNREKIMEKAQTLSELVDNGDYRIKSTVDRHIIYHGDNNVKVEKHLPLLKASGLAGCIGPLDIYLSFEEYFSLEKQALERTASKDITDTEKLENHGFDRKKSFRGKAQTK